MPFAARSPRAGSRAGSADSRAASLRSAPAAALDMRTRRELAVLVAAAVDGVTDELGATLALVEQCVTPAGVPYPTTDLPACFAAMRNSGRRRFVFFTFSPKPAQVATSRRPASRSRRTSSPTSEAATSNDGIARGRRILTIRDLTRDQASELVPMILKDIIRSNYLSVSKITKKSKRDAITTPG